MATNSESRDRVCSDCRALAIDILSGNTHSNNRWQIIQSEHATLSYAKSHQDGTVATLQRSAGRGCQLCSLIRDKVCELDGSRSASFYHIFVWDKVPEKCQFQIAIREIRIYIKHISEWQPPKSLAFFGQLTSIPKLPDLGNVNSSSNGDRPLLSYLPNQYPGSPEAFHQARKWLAECQNYHPECIRPPSILPKRVLDLGKPDEELKVALYITRGEIKPYMALSYTWGETDRLVTCRNSNDNPLPVEGSQFPTTYVIKRLIPERKFGQAKSRFICESFWSPDDIPLNAFPETLRDALQITKALGFRYIWIDSLCILQGDTHDWAHQGAAMTDIYGRSTLTISATSTQSSNKSILSELQNDRIGIGTWWHCETSKKPVEIFVGDTMKTLDLEENFISTRGWVFQERLVSTATLHYTEDGMVWECAHGTCLDHDQNVSSVQWKANWRNIMRQAISDPSNAAFVGALGKNRYDVWYEWISAYSERNLFDSRDKFPAIAGVAKKFAQVFGLTYPAYAAGLWRDDFVTGLLWRRHNRTETLIPLREKYVAPTWSWGFVKGRLEFRSATLIDSNNKGPTLKVHEYNVFEKHPGTYGRLLQGTILVEGLLQAVVVDRQSHPGVRQKPFQECGVSHGFVNNVNVLCMLDEYVQSAPRDYLCWCLRIGSYDLYGREADVFLLLDRVDGSNNEFYRVGFAETDAWWDRLLPTPNSGLLVSASPTILTIK